MGTILTLNGAAMYVYAIARYASEYRGMAAAGAKPAPTWLIGVLVAPLVVVSLLALLLLVP
jgi:hypothetical protein